MGHGGGRYPRRLHHRNHGISVKTSVLYVSSRRLFTHPRESVRYQTSLWGDVGKEISNEIEHAKHALIQVGRSFVQDFFIQVLPALAQSFGSRRPNERPNDRSQGTRGNGSEFQRDV